MEKELGSKQKKIITFKDYYPRLDLLQTPFTAMSNFQDYKPLKLPLVCQFYLNLGVSDRDWPNVQISSVSH